MLLKTKAIFKNIPITLRITLWYSFFILGLLAAIIAASAAIADEIFEDVSQKKLAKSVVEIANDLDDFEPFDDGIFFIKYDKKGNIIGGLAPKNFDASLKMTNGEIAFYENGENSFFYYDSMAKKGNVWIRGVASADGFFQGAGWFLLALGVLVPLLFLLVLYGGYKMIKNALKPVGVMSKTALEIGDSKDFSKRIELPVGKDELHSLANTLNLMLSKLEHAYAQEKQLTADVSHELRTPTAIILAQSDYALNYELDEAETRESFEVINRQSRKISLLIEQILELSRIENAKSFDPKPLNLSRILNHSLDDFERLINGRDIRLEKNIEQGVQILGDELLVERLIDNLLSNALKFTKSVVKVELSSQDIWCELVVSDDGAGISLNEQELIWDKFYQCESSRNKENNAGAGLGLSLIKEIARLHEAKLHLRTQPNLGASFSVKFSLLRG